MIKKYFLSLIVLLSSITIETKLPTTKVLIMARALSCNNENSSSSIVSGNPFVDYTPFIALMSDYQALKFIINNIIVSNTPQPRLTTVNYLYVPYYKKTNGNFDNCDLGFYPNNATNQFSATVALTLANFSGSSMMNSIWEKMFLYKSNFSNVNASNANFNYIKGPNIIFSHANLTNASFQHAYIPCSYFNSLPNTPSTILSNTNFTGAYLPKASFENASLLATRFINADMKNVNLKNTNCTGAQFDYSYGSFIVSRSTNFTNASFKTSLIFLDIPEGESPIFKDTIMPNGDICSGSDCLNHFRQIDLSATK